MTLNELEWFSKKFDDTNHRAVSLRQLSFLFRRVCATAAAVLPTNYITLYFFLIPFIRWNGWIKLYSTSQKTCDYIFDDKLNYNCLFTTIFGKLITNSIGHRRIFLFSHHTYFVHLLYGTLGNCQDLNMSKN